MPKKALLSKYLALTGFPATKNKAPVWSLGALKGQSTCNLKVFEILFRIGTAFDKALCERKVKRYIDFLFSFLFSHFHTLYLKARSHPLHVM